MPVTPPDPRHPLVSYLRMEQSHVSAIERILSRAASELGKDIAALKTGTHPLTRAQLEAQRAAIRAHLNQDWSDIQRATATGQKAAAEEASRVISRYENVLLQAVMSDEAMQTLADAEARRAAQSVNTLLMRLSSSQKTLSQQVYSTKALTNGWIDELINVALAKGQSAAQLARSVRQFISPSTPGGASYAAKRLARTEINNAFHAASVDRYQKSGLVETVDWHLSSSHPEGDICDSYASDGPYDVNNVPEKPHPMCFCFTTPALPSREDFIKNLLAGKYGDEPWIDDVAPENLPSAVFSGLSKAEEDAIARYTQNSFALNAKLRSGAALSDAEKAEVDLLDGAFEKSSLSRTTNVRRVVGDRDVFYSAISRSKSRGAVYSDPAYMSTQKTAGHTMEEIMDEFGQGANPGTTVIFEISLPKGTPAIDIGGKLDDHPLALGFNQDEVLLPRGMKFSMSEPVMTANGAVLRLKPKR